MKSENPPHPPRRTFLDSSVLQLMHDFGDVIWDWVPVPVNSAIRLRPTGAETLRALQNIFSVTQRVTDWEFIVSDASQKEVNARGSHSYSSWVEEVRTNSDYLLQIEQQAYPSRRHADMVLEWKRVGYLGAGDRQLIADALRFGCDAFLTDDRRLARNAAHIQKQIRVGLFTPEEYWERLRPWAALFA